MPGAVDSYKQRQKWRNFKLWWGKVDASECASHRPGTGFRKQGVCRSQGEAMSSRTAVGERRGTQTWRSCPKSQSQQKTHMCHWSGRDGESSNQSDEHRKDSIAPSPSCISSLFHFCGYIGKCTSTAQRQTSTGFICFHIYSPTWISSI